jgi:hypothetical protein
METRYADRRPTQYPKWLKELVKSMGLSPDSVRVNVETPLRRVMSAGFGYAEHTDEVTITVHGTRMAPPPPRRRTRKTSKKSKK